MAIKHNVHITNGKGTLELIKGTYKVTSNVEGYDNTTLTPTNVTIEDGKETYAFTISANGTLTLHITEEGTSTGTKVTNTKFIRTDKNGTQLGDILESDSDGNIKILNVPYSSSTTFTIYYKQILSDGNHTFNEEIQSIEMKTKQQTVEITNPKAPTRIFTLSDVNLTNIPIESADLYLESAE